MLRNSRSNSYICALAIFVLLIAACGKEQRESLCLVCIIDLTRSLETESQREAFDAIQSTLKEMRRGDRIAIIPITGDAMTQSQGRIIRFQLSDRREAYDEDLRRFSQEVAERLQHMRDEAANSPYNHSDIMGAVRLAGEELASARSGARRAIVLLSDLLQDDAQYDFKRDTRLASNEAAAKFAALLPRDQEQALQNSAVFLGLLRSVELKNVPQTRRAALQTFWREFFTRQGAASVRSATDGAGQMATFAQQQRDQKERGK